MQLKVIKADGTAEEYLHTKVFGTINNALSAAGEADINAAEEFAEVVTYFLYHRENRQNITSNEILSIIKATLTATGYEEAAVALSEHHFERKLKRSRIEVIPVKIQDLADAKLLCKTERLTSSSRWNKAIIVDDLVSKHSLSRQMARTIASMVEEKVFNIGLTLVPASLIKQLVLGDAASIIQVQQQLQTI